MTVGAMFRMTVGAISLDNRKCSAAHTVDSLHKQKFLSCASSWALWKSEPIETDSAQAVSESIIARELSEYSFGRQKTELTLA